MNARNWLSNYTENGDKFFERIRDSKFDQEVAIKLGIEGNLQRDYKNYSLNRDGFTGMLGISTLVFSCNTLLSRFGPNSVE